MRNLFRGALVAILLAAAPVRAELANELADHPSPYLAMHADNPVHWQVWGQPALKKARQEGKLVYVSVGYFACHWCHVMERESYQNPGIAKILNEHFIPIKVDRELQPALDTRLSQFVQRTQGYSGWPLNVFLTPQGYPLFGMVYQPPDAFRDILNKLKERWASQTQQLRKLAQDAASQMRPPPLNWTPELDHEWAERVEQRLAEDALERADTVSGGFGDQNKFPQAPQLQALLDVYERDGGERLGEFLRLTLDQMATRGLRDHLGGGFFRYVTDPTWEVPHFEKMLYDNAVLSELYHRAGQVFDEPRYTSIGRDTLDFMLSRMRTDRGSFIASLSAVDEEGVEGGYYLWDRATLKGALDADVFAVAERVWGLEGSPEFEHGHLPMRVMDLAQAASELDITSQQARQRLARAREQLLAARGQRGLPRDDKVVASWNGLALRALSVASGEEEGRRRYKRAAADLARLLMNAYWRDGRLVRARSSDQRPAGDAGLEDYAYVGSGLAAWARASADERVWQQARRVVTSGWDRFFTPRGWRLSEDLLIPYAGADPVVSDSQTPSPSAMLIEATLAVADHYDDAELRDKATAALGVGKDMVQAEPFWFASQLRVVSEVHRATKSANEQTGQ